MTELHHYLIEHPVRIWLPGFRLKPAAPGAVLTFDVVGSLPSARHLRRKLRTLDQATLTGLLKQTVQQALVLVPSLGQTVSIDTKHIYADVKENNPRAYVIERFKPSQQPRADPDCRLGAKRSSNQIDDQGATKTKTAWLSSSHQGRADHGGIAAIALNLRGNPLTLLGEHDQPLCRCNQQEMAPRAVWQEPDGHREQRFCCLTCGAIRKSNGLIRKRKH